MVRAGEAGGSAARHAAAPGRLPRAQPRAARARDQRADLSGDPAGRWSAGALLFLLGYVVPQFVAMFESLDAELPLFTQIVLGIGLFVRDWWIVLLVGAGAGACGGSTASGAIRPSATRFDAWLLRRSSSAPLVAQARNRAPGAHAGHAAAQRRAAADRAGHRRATCWATACSRRDVEAAADGRQERRRPVHRARPAASVSRAWRCR